MTQAHQFYTGTIQERIDHHAAAITELRAEMNRCNHDFSPAKQIITHHPSYEIPGDPPGTMGVDWRGPCYVPARDEIIFRKTCCKCGMRLDTSPVYTTR